MTRYQVGDAEAPCDAALRHLGRWGGMPELLHPEDADRRQWLRSYHDTYLQRDLAGLARDAGLSPTTARNYLEYLKVSYQVFLLQPFRENLTSSVVKAPKLYWTDIGVARYLTGVSGPLSGGLFETLVVGEAIKVIRTLGLEVESSFYRTRSGMEVDLLLSSSRGVIALEAKARSGWASSDLRGMKALAQALGPRFLVGLVVTSGGAIEPASSDGRLWCVPAHRLFS